MLAEPTAEPGPGMGPSRGPSSDSACPKLHAPHPSSSLCGPYSQGWMVGPALGRQQLPPDHRPRQKQPTGCTAGPLSHTGAQRDQGGGTASGSARVTGLQETETGTERQRDREIRRPAKEKLRDAKRGRDRKGLEVGTDIRVSPSHTHTHTHPHAPHSRPLGPLEPRSGSLRPGHVLWG